MAQHRVFITYHHANDQQFKEDLVKFGKNNNIFIDQSVDTGDISDNSTDERIREKIRDDYLRDTTVTIVLVGTETRNRKHVDWEIYSSMINGQKNKKSGILVINLPSVANGYVWAPHGHEETNLYPSDFRWSSVTSRNEFEQRHPYMPGRIIDSLVKGVKISVTEWDLLNTNKLRFLIDAAYNERSACNYDLSTPMRRQNS